MSIQDLIPFHSFSPLKQSQSLEYQRSIMIYHVVSMVLPTCSLQRRVCQTQTGRGLSGMIRWAGGIQCHSTFWGRGCKRYVERKVILASSEVKMREGSGQFIHLFQGLHFTFGGWTLDFPDASISLAVGDKVDQVCLKLLDSQLGEWRGCLWTATEVIYIYIYMYIRVGVLIIHIFFALE